MKLQKAWMLAAALLLVAGTPGCSAERDSGAIPDIRVITERRRWLTKSARILAADLIAYLDYKRGYVDRQPEPMHQLKIS